MEPYVTLSETMHELRKDGYVVDFNLQQNCLECRNGQFKVFADEFKVDKYFRFGNKAYGSLAFKNSERRYCGLLSY
jgi:hypothetical protein